MYVKLHTSNCNDSAKEITSMNRVSVQCRWSACPPMSASWAAAYMGTPWCQQPQHRVCQPSKLPHKTPLPAVLFRIGALDRPPLRLALRKLLPQHQPRPSTSTSPTCQALSQTHSCHIPTRHPFWAWQQQRKTSCRWVPRRPLRAPPPPCAPSRWLPRRPPPPFPPSWARCRAGRPRWSSPHSLCPPARAATAPGGHHGGRSFCHGLLWRVG